MLRCIGDMEPRVLAVAALVAACLFIAWYVQAASDRLLGAYLGGVWVADPAFLREAGLSQLYLYVAPGPGRRRPAYASAVAADGATAAPTTVWLGRVSLLDSAPLRGKMRATLTFEGEEGAPFPFGRHRVRGVVDTVAGTLRGPGALSFTKDNEASAVADREYAADPETGGDGVAI